ncbi:MAG: sigma-70 family RNA polymerase sigma factor [Acidobacteria bacterium]|nr:MAG: sigma-70 family RNA polymerase sigma factor [Acidobacteriota bacterium]
MVRLNFGPMAKKAKEKEPEAEYIPPDEEDLTADDSLLDSVLERKDDEDVVPEEREKVAKLDPLRKYLLEVSHFEPLTPEEEHRLAILYREENNEQAAYRLVTSNLRLVVKIAFLYSRIYQNVMDLIQEGNIGLMEAVKRFDPYRGARLPTYAAWWIKAYIIKFILDNFRIVRLGTTNERRKLLFNLRKEKEKLRLQGIEPTAALVAARLNVKPEEIEAVEGTIEGSDLSLDSYVNDQEDTRYVDTLAATEELIDEKLARGELRSLFQQKFQEFARNLSERERVILEQRLIADEPITLQEIADQFGVTREAIRLNEKALVGRIRNYMQTELKDVTRVEFGLIS